MVNVYDPVNPFSKDRLEFQNQILKGRYNPILDLYPRSLQNSKGHFRKTGMIFSIGWSIVMLLTQHSVFLVAALKVME